MPGFFASFPSSGGGGVTTLNGLTGALTLVAGSGITITPSGNNLTIASTGGGTVTSVGSGTGLTGGPITTSGSLSLANTAVTPGAYTSANITVDQQGRITAAANGSASPTGNVNTSAYFNGSGNLTSNTSAKFDDSLNARVDFIDAGGGTAVATAEGAYAHGVGSNGTMSAGGRGSIAQGEVDSGGGLSTGQAGSIAAGLAHGGGNIGAGANGSFAHGDVNAGGISASGSGSEAAGSATGGGISASGIGAKAFGNSSNNSIVAGTDGALAHGSATNGSIVAGGLGSYCAGNPQSAGDNTASGSSSFAIGDGVTASGDNSAVFGFGNTGVAFSCLSIGRFSNSTGTSGSWSSTEQLFIAGNGTSTGSKANAYELSKDGRVTETGANRVPVRILTGTDTLSARSDRKLVLNGAGALTLNLPAGEEGLCYQFGAAAANTGVWTLAPNGGDTIDATIATINTANGIIFTGGVWYQCY